MNHAPFHLIGMTDILLHTAKTIGNIGMGASFGGAGQGSAL